MSSNVTWEIIHSTVQHNSKLQAEFAENSIKYCVIFFLALELVIIFTYNCFKLEKFVDVINNCKPNNFSY